MLSCISCNFSVLHLSLLPPPLLFYLPSSAVLCLLTFFFSYPSVAISSAPTLSPRLPSPNFSFQKGHLRLTKSSVCHSRVICDQVACPLHTDLIFYFLKTHKHRPTEKLVIYMQLLVMLLIPACYKLVVLVFPSLGLFWFHFFLTCKGISCFVHTF